MDGDRCMFCERIVTDYSPDYCCDGYMCGCQGMPVDPPMHEHCVVIDFLQKLKKFHEDSREKNISISMCRSFPGGKTKLENHSKLISTEDITSEEGQYVMDCQGFTNGVAERVDYLIELLGGALPEENPDKIESRTKILDL